ncbi:hypothetical protein E2C01_047953 [Portunus trituberculatus]|uniref:Uncharacterized protein n=1 Tax=Portunus trituberculatus TaxID=210409 RepID=A0A5B7G996_PORTR|nr:hypothetical protein [Portunus trituberculatus]
MLPTASPAPPSPATLLPTASLIC